MTETLDTQTDTMYLINQAKSEQKYSVGILFGPVKAAVIQGRT